MEPAALERLKLEDGIRVHESTKVDLEVYAQQNSLRRVKPFMLVIASDTEHADQLVKVIESEEFFDGRYKGRVIQVHSGQKGAERDENVERLLAVEDPDEPTEVVVHVNMLKEGWDVTNLYTIVPLRSADSRTLVEQSIGRGLRLPYGRRTGVAAVDRLTIVAHDRFQDIVDEAKRGGYSFSTIQIGIDVPDVPKETVTAVPVFEKVLGLDTQSTTMNDASQASWGAATGTIPRSPAQAAMARLAVEAIARMARDPKVAPNTAALRSQDVQQRLVDQVATNMNLGQLGLFPNLDTNELASTVKQVTDAFIAHTIAIPRVQLIPQGIVEAGFHAFTLELSSLRLQPVAKEIIVENLTDHAREIIGALEQGLDEDRLEDYVVRGLIDFDDVCYDEQADLLYGLAGQVVSHLRGYLSDDAEVRNVLLFHQRQIANLVHTQMQPHSWEKAAGYELKVSQGFAEVRREKFAKPITEGVRPFGVPIDNKIDIRQMLFGGFKKCVYAEQKFDSDVERRFAVILEGDSEVQKWLKPGKGDFQIRYTKDNDYEPDFVVETETEKLICEPKRADQMQDPIVQAKAKAAKTWCQHAADHERKHGGKPWRYVLIPHDAIADNMTVRGLAERFGT
jgi:type III restriction enzyme